MLLCLAPLVPYVIPHLGRFPAQAVPVYHWGSEARSPEIFFLDSRKLLLEFPACYAFQLLSNLVQAEGYPHPADNHVNAVPVITHLNDGQSQFSCCPEQQLYATVFELRNVKDIVAIFYLEAYMRFQPEKS